MNRTDVDFRRRIAWLLVLTMITVMLSMSATFAVEDDVTVPGTVVVPKNPTNGVPPDYGNLIATPTPTATATPSPSGTATPSPSGSVNPSPGTGSTATPSPSPSSSATPAAASTLPASTAPAITTTPTSSIPEAVVVTRVQVVVVTSDAAGRQSSKATVTASQLVDALAAAGMESPNPSPDANPGPLVAEIEAQAAPGASVVEVDMPALELQKLAVEANTGIRLSTGLAELTLDADVVRHVTAGSSGTVRISVETVRPDDLPESVPEEMKQLVRDRPVYDFSVTVGDKAVSSFGGSRVQVSVPYVLREGERPESIVVYFLSDEGVLTPVFGRYAEGRVTFETGHFSKYVVANRPVSFLDVKGEDEWYAAVGFIAARGITLGDGKGRFLPDAYLTRGEFMTMLMRAYGIVPSEADLADNFMDAKHAFYSGAVASAKRMGITNGVGQNRFNPGGTISRQEMQVMVYRLLQKTGKKVPHVGSGKAAATYADFGSVAVWGREAMDAFARHGVLVGGVDRMAPLAAVKRQEMAVFLYKLLQ